MSSPFNRECRPSLLLVGYFIMSMGINAYFIAPASVVPFLIEAHEITKASAGLAVSVPILGSVLLQIPGGLLMDRYDNRILSFGATLTFTLTTLAGVFLRTYPLWLFTRFIAGICAIFLFTMGAKVVAGSYSPARRGFATTVFTASAPLGVAFGQFTGSHLAKAFGLEFLFIVYSSISVVGYSLFYMSTPDPIHSSRDVDLNSVLCILTNRSIILMSVSAACTYALYFFLNAWLPTYGTEELSLPLGSAGAIAALVPIMGVLGRPSGGWLSDQVGSRRRPIVFGAIVIALPLFAVISRAPTLFVFVLFLLFVGFVLQLSMGIYFVYVQELAEEGTAGTALAVFGTIGFTGSLVSPFVGGWLIDRFTWVFSFGIYVLVGIIGAVLILFIPESEREL